MAHLPLTERNKNINDVISTFAAKRDCRKFRQPRIVRSRGEEICRPSEIGFSTKTGISSEFDLNFQVDGNQQCNWSASGNLAAPGRG